MLSNEFIAMQWTKARQTELMEERKNDRLLRYIIREYKAQLRERRNRNTQK